jgi:flagellar FliL protein
MPPAPNRVEGAPEEIGAAPETAAAPASGGIKAWLPLIVMVLLMPALAYAMTTFVIVPKLQKGLGGSTATTSASATPSESGAKSKKSAAAVKKESVALNKLLVNVNGASSRFLLVSLSVVGSASDFKAQMESHDAQLRDIAQSTLATKTLADLEKPTARNMIRNELISGFNNVLGDGAVEEIYFPEFAIQ